jgi:hypothetical protein
VTDWRTRMTLLPVAWLIWAAALLCRLGTFLDEPEREDDELLLSATIGVLVAYVAWLAAIHVLDQQWLWGWRR